MDLVKDVQLNIMKRFSIANLAKIKHYVLLSFFALQCVPGGYCVADLAKKFLGNIANPFVGAVVNAGTNALTGRQQVPSTDRYGRQIILYKDQSNQLFNQTGQLVNQFGEPLQPMQQQMMQPSMYPYQPMQPSMYNPNPYQLVMPQQPTYNSFGQQPMNPMMPQQPTYNPFGQQPINPMMPQQSIYNSYGQQPMPTPYGQLPTYGQSMMFPR
jgi:hypothetical protein